MKYTTLFYSRPFIWLIVFLFISGAYLVSRQWDQFLHTFSHFFNAEGLLFYGIALVVVKCAHELGHAYTATRYGCRVSTMGVAFLVMFPVLFTDTTDTWKLTSKRQRLAVGAAGIGVELMIAVIATFLWAFLPDGPARSAAFFIATTSWFMTVAINMNPLMRFDGYHLLSDLIGIQNLQSRCFALGKWCMRELLFGFGEPEPESLPPRMKLGLIVLAWCTWIYRLFLFLGIALLVHAFFFKPLGSILAVVEIAFFIAIPIVIELRQWLNRRSALTMNIPVLRTSVLTFALLAAFLVPWQTTLRIPAVLEAGKHTPVFATQPGVITKQYVAQGDVVEAGDVLFDVESPSLVNSIERTSRRLELIDVRLGTIAVDSDMLNQKMVLQQEREQLIEELAALQRDVSRLTVTASIGGVVMDLSPSVHAGRWIHDQLQLASIVSNEGARIRGFIVAADINRVASGEQSVFIPDELSQQKLTGVLNLVNSMDAETINIPALTSVNGGPIAVAPEQDELKPLKAWYNVSVDLDDPSLVVGQISRGQLHTAGAPETLAIRVWRRAVQVLIREVLI